MKPIEKTKFYMCSPHPLDPLLPSFLIINIVERTTEKNTPECSCEFFSLVPNIKQDEKTKLYGWSYGWRLLSDHPAWVEDTVITAFSKVREVAIEHTVLAYREASRRTEDYVAGESFKIVSKEADDNRERLAKLILTATSENDALIDRMIERSKCQGFQDFLAGPFFATRPK